MDLIKIVNAYNAIDSFSENENIGVHLAYAMAKFIVATQSDVDFYNKEIRKLFEKYGSKNEVGSFVIPTENVESFQEEALQLRKTDVTDPGIRFSLKELSTELKVSMKQIYPLLDFINNDQEE